MGGEACGLTGGRARQYPVSMRATTLLLPILLPACVEPAPLPKGADDSATTSGGDGGDSGSPYFEPLTLSLSGFQAGWDGAAVGGFVLPPDEAVAPFVDLQFVTEDWYLTGDAAEQCVWRGDLAVTDLAVTPNFVSVAWTGQLTERWTDCANFDPSIWPGGAPGPTLTATAVRMAVATPTQRLTADFQQYVDGFGIGFPGPWEDYVMGVGLAFVGGQVGADGHAEEIGWAVSRAVDADGVLVLDEAGAATPVAVDGTKVPAGALRGWGRFPIEVGGVTATGPHPPGE